MLCMHRHCYFLRWGWEQGRGGEERKCLNQMCGVFRLLSSLEHFFHAVAETSHSYMCEVSDILEVSRGTLINPQT